MSGDELFDFPCDFPLKVMGRNSDTFRSRIEAIVLRHAGDEVAPTVSARPSRNGRYVALSFRLRAHSREQLDALYRELSASDDVLWAL